MDKVKQWMITIIICSIVAVVVNILTPDSNVKKTMKIVVSTFLICAFVSPFISSEKISFKDDLPEFSLYYSSLSLDISETMISEAEHTAVEKISAILNENAIQYQEISVNAEVDDENAIYLESVKIVLDDVYKTKEKEITEKINAMFGVETDFLWVSD